MKFKGSQGRFTNAEDEDIKDIEDNTFLSPRQLITNMQS